MVRVSAEVSFSSRIILDSTVGIRLTTRMNHPAAPNGGIAASLGQVTGYQSFAYPLCQFTVRQTSTKSRDKILPDYQTGTDTDLESVGL